MSKKILREQLLPLSLTFLVFLLLALALYQILKTLNTFANPPIILKIHSADIIVGLVIYLKTAIDFAIFIAHLMRVNPSWKSRVAIETGTAFGNAFGTICILVIWVLFKEVKPLLAVMVLIASFVLLLLAQDGLEHAKSNDQNFPSFLKKAVIVLDKFLSLINRYLNPILKRLLPHVSLTNIKPTPFTALVGFSFTVPFILGLDDFAGYVPLFNVVNVFGFSLGVLLGHMLLNAFLFLSPTKTVAIVKNPVISFLGSVAFVGIALWGLFEVVKILIHLG